MGSLADRLNTAAPAQAAGQCEVGPDGGEFTGITTTEPITDWSDIFRRFNLDPESFEIAGDTVRMSVWQSSKRTEDGDRDIINLYSYRAQFTRRRDNLDLPALYAAARRTPRKRLAPVDSDRVTVVVLSDVQAGKTAHRGGTPELVERLQDVRARLEQHLKTRKPSRTVLAEAGDLFEGYESSGNPMFTNDLSLAQQLDLAGTEVFEFVNLMHRHGRVDVMAVPSNHTAWRRGRQNLGRPSDDLGLQVHRTVQKITHAAGMDAHWSFPDPFDEAMTLDVNGTVLGLVHGNQYGPGKAVEWWAKQQHGGQCLARADILITGHYHSLSVMPTGRNPHTGKSKWWLQAPTLDNGSDWFRTVAGDDSDPGLLVFDVTADGFDLSSLTVL